MFSTLFHKKNNYYSLHYKKLNGTFILNLSAPTILGLLKKFLWFLEFGCDKKKRNINLRFSINMLSFFLTIIVESWNELKEEAERKIWFIWTQLLFGQEGLNPICFRIQSKIFAKQFYLAQKEMVKETWDNNPGDFLFEYQNSNSEGRGDFRSCHFS